LILQFFYEKTSLSLTRKDPSGSFFVRKSNAIVKWREGYAVLNQGQEIGWIRKFQHCHDRNEGCIAQTNDELAKEVNIRLIIETNHD
jgi:hypothetical protein